jgi:hypothetical protein
MFCSRTAIKLGHSSDVICDQEEAIEWSSESRFINKKSRQGTNTPTQDTLPPLDDDDHLDIRSIIQGNSVKCDAQGFSLNFSKRAWRLGQIEARLKPSEIGGLYISEPIFCSANADNIPPESQGRRSYDKTPVPIISISV